MGRGLGQKFLQGRLANGQLAQEKCSGPPNTRSTSQNPNKTFHPIEWLQLKTNMN